ncbi:MAG: MBL fold metallo-hydrolase [Lawsonibacter sp.]|jgi:glyoxylase-like metal-dependent hydrolase (beta-lactamase superfamily II)|nr:MBL fold metallo-hydrolase [Lawsonibacter sp.]
MRFQVDVLFSGFSGKLETGYLGWGTWAYLTDGAHNMMLDTGYVGLRQNYGEILASHRIRAEEVTHVLLTHMHFDHACNVDQYPNAEFVLSRQEWEYANDPERRDLFVETGALATLRAGRLRLVEDGEEIVPGVTAMLTPGHTPGCCSYVLQQEDGSRWVLAGDAAKNRGELRTREVQMSMDPAATSASLRRIIETADRVLPGHDGWVTVRNGEVIPEGENDKVMIFGQGVRVNGGQSSVVLHMD